MPRIARVVRANGFYHALNRGNGRQAIFHKPGDYAAFVRILAEGLAEYPVDLLAWCLMPNHWHLVLSPRTSEALGRFMGWVGVTHVRRHHEHHHTRGGGHLYQGRFKSFPMQDDPHFLTVCRYVEANPKRAGIVERAEDWPWSSLNAGAPAGYEGMIRRYVGKSAARKQQAGPPAWPRLGAWPVPRPPDWVALVNRAMSKQEQERLRTSVNRGRPFGDPAWVEREAEDLGLEHTLRDPGRPRKEKEEENNQ